MYWEHSICCQKNNIEYFSVKQTYWIYKLKSNILFYVYSLITLIDSLGRQKSKVYPHLLK